MPDERDAADRPPHRDHGRGRTRTPAAGSGTVSGVIDPDNTPVDAIVAAIEDDFGMLGARDKGFVRAVVVALSQHQEHGQRRVAAQAANHTLAVAHDAQTGGIDVDELRQRLAVDVQNWQPFKGDRDRLDSLEEAEAGRKAALAGLKRWLAGSWLVAALALAGGLIDYGTRRGRSDSASAQTAEDRRLLVEATARNHAQNIDIEVLRALVQDLKRNQRRNNNGDD